MSPNKNIEVSNSIPDWFSQVVCGLLLSDATLRQNGKHALMGIQQTHEELVNNLWQMCYDLNLVLSDIFIIKRVNWKPIYSFQTLILPYFTSLYVEWYKTFNGKKNIKFYLIIWMLYLLP